MGRICNGTAKRNPQCNARDEDDCDLNLLLVQCSIIGRSTDVELIFVKLCPEKYCSGVPI
jgi:hypothetical protein